MSLYRILILNGPNLGRIGVREPEIYGSRTLDDLPAMLTGHLGPKAEGVELAFFQSNHEGALIDRLEQAHDTGEHGVAFNAGAYTHTSLALTDCIGWIRPPVVEVHISNIWARTADPIRQQSYMGARCAGVVAGFGLMSYVLAVGALLSMLDNGQG